MKVFKIMRDWVVGYAMRDMLHAENPRKEPTNIGSMVLFSPTWNLCEVSIPRGALLINEYMALLRRRYETVLPYHMFCEPSGSLMGAIAITNSAMRRAYEVTRLNDTIREQAVEQLQKEMRDLDYFLRGEVYSIEVQDRSGNILDCAQSIYGEQEAKEALSKLMDFYINEYRPWEHDGFKKKKVVK